MDKAKRKKQYGKLSLLARASTIFLVFLFAIFYTFIFYKTSLFINADKDYKYIILPSFATWFIFAIFLGIISALLPAGSLFRFLLGSRKYKELNVYMAKEDGIGRKKRKTVIKRFCALSFLIIFVCAVIFSLLFGYYIKINDSHIVVNRFKELTERTYDFNDIAELRQVESVNEDGKVYKKFGEIVFRDDYVISFDKDNFNKNFEEQSEILNFISDKSDIEIQIINPAN